MTVAGRLAAIRRAVPRPLPAAGAAGLLVASYAMFVEPRWFALRRVTVPLLRPGAASDLRVLHLSDLHLQPRHASLRSFLERCLAEDPDVVVMTGDILGHPAAVEPAVNLLAAASRGRSALFVLGSNDWFGPTVKNPLRYFRRRRDITPSGEPLRTGELVHRLTDAGWQQVDNRRVRLDSRAGPVEVTGVGDAHLGADRVDVVDVPPGATDAALRLGVTHAPYRRVLDAMDAGGLDLALAGHTHGGQVRVPGVGALVDNCDLPLGQARGLSGYGAGLTLHVSAGLGASRYTPFRFACRPEATMLDLVPATEHPVSRI